MTKRLKMTLADGEWRPVKELLKRRFPYLPPSTAAKLILLELSEMTDAQPDTVTRGDSESPVVPDSHPESPQVPCPDPAPPPAKPPDPDQDQKDRDPERKKRGSVRGGLLAAKVAETVVDLVNTIRPGGRGFDPKTYIDEVAKLLAKGHKEPDLIAVVKWKAAECKRTGSWEWFKPATLFRVRAFGEKLDEARAGVEHGKGPQQGLFGGAPKESTAQVQAKQQDYTPPKGWK